MKKSRKKFLNIIFIIEIVICIGIVVSLPIRYIAKEREKVEEKVERANEKAFMNLMACGTVEDGRRAREYWSQNGVIGWTEWDKDQIDEVYKMIANDDMLEVDIRNDYKDGINRYTYEEFLDMCYKIFYGGITFSEKMKMELFYDGIDEIYEKTDVDLKDRFEDLVYDRHGRVQMGDEGDGV